MNIYKYKNHDEYIDAQKTGVYNHPCVPNSLEYEWVQRSDVEFIWSEIIKPHFKQLGREAKYGICHGAKLGKENMWFQDVTGIEFIGTDLIVATNEKTNLLNWDFHNIREEWKGHFDVIYSNALDHSYDPTLALKQWISCLAKGGICVIEHTKFHVDATAIDPFGASLQEYEKLIENCGGIIICKKNFSSNVDKTFLTFRRSQI